MYIRPNGVTNQFANKNQKNWVGNSKIPVPGNHGVKFKDSPAVSTAFAGIKSVAATKGGSGSK